MTGQRGLTQLWFDAVKESLKAAELDVWILVATAPTSYGPQNFVTSL